MSPHVCLSFDGRAAFEAAAVTFLAEGRAAGERTWFVGSDRPDTLDESVRFLPVQDTYSRDAVIDPAAQMSVYRAATEAALVAGFTGLRVAADVTPLVGTSEQLDMFARYEHLMDRYMAVHPFAAMCAYDRRVLGDDAVGEVAVMHSSTNADVLFHLHGVAPAHGHAALGGELDMTTGDPLARAWERAALRPEHGEVVLDASGLRFADHRSLMEFDDRGRRLGATVVLRDAFPSVARLAALLEPTHLRVEAAR